MLSSLVHISLEVHFHYRLKSFVVELQLREYSSLSNCSFWKQKAINLHDSELLQTKNPLPYVGKHLSHVPTTTFYE